MSSLHQEKITKNSTTNKKTFFKKNPDFSIEIGILLNH